MWDVVRRWTRGGELKTGRSVTTLNGMIRRVDGEADVALAVGLERVKGHSQAISSYWSWGCTVPF